MSYDANSVGATLSWALAATPTISIVLPPGNSVTVSPMPKPARHVGVADDRLAVGGRQASVHHVGRGADAVAVDAEFVAEQRDVERFAVGVPARHPGERSLADPTDLAHPGGGTHLFLHRWRDHAALDHALAVDAVHEDRRALLTDRPDEAGDQAVLERLLEQDQEHQQRDGGHEQREAHLRPSHLLERQEHRRGTYRLWPTERPLCQAAPMTYPVALYLQDAHDIREGIELVRYAESRGFDAVWQADSRLVRDAVVPMAAFGATTDRIRIGSGVIDCWTRNPARLASTFSTLDDLAPGRMICGLGAWWDPLAAKVGIDRSRPLKVMREVVEAVRGLLNNETVTMDGYHVHLDGVELDYVHQERRPKQVPIYIGATGMQMMELTGEIADGAVLNYLVSPSYNVGALEALQRGADKVGRSLDDIDRPQLVVCSVDDDRAAALDGARLLVTQYLGQQPHIMKASGVPQELLDEIGEVLTWPATHDQVVAASKLVPDDIVQMITASGTPDEVRAKVDEYVAAGCTCPILYPLADDVRLMIDTFARN